MEYRKEYKGKTVLVTGGAGCIGSNLTRALLEADVEKVIILDDLSAAVEWNIPNDKRVKFIKGSVVLNKDLMKCFYYRPTIVFHLAAHFANQNSIDHPIKDLETNGIGTMKTLGYAMMSKVERFVYASSGCSVYGSQAPLPLKEDYISINLDTHYQIHKLLGECYCNFFYNYYKLPVTRARFFNVFGKFELPGLYRNVIPNFIWKALHNKPLVITGTGEETRDFTYVDDIVDGTLRLGVMKEAVGEAFNLASSIETRVIDIANHINQITGNNKIEYTNKRSWDKIDRRRASIKKAQKVLGYQPQTLINVGIKNTYNWILENKDKIERDAKF